MDKGGVLPLLMVSVLSVSESLHAEELLPLNLGSCGITLWVPVSHLTGRVVVRVLRTRERLQRQAFGHIGQRLKCTEKRETADTSGNQL